MPTGSGSASFVTFTGGGTATTGGDSSGNVVNLPAMEAAGIGINRDNIVITGVDDFSEYTRFFLTSTSSIIEYDLVEISHPNFSQVYRVVRNNSDGLTVTLETGQPAFFDYYPLALEGSSLKNDLDYIVKIKLGDLGQILPKEMDNVRNAPSGFKTKPTVIIRSYRSDDLTKPMFGPLVLEVVEFNFNKDGAEFEAKAPALNINRTGEIYDFERFPMLRGFV